MEFYYRSIILRPRVAINGHDDDHDLVANNSAAAANAAIDNSDIVSHNRKSKIFCVVRNSMEKQKILHFK